MYADIVAAGAGRGVILCRDVTEMSWGRKTLCHEVAVITAMILTVRYCVNITALLYTTEKERSMTLPCYRICVPGVGHTLLPFVRATSRSSTTISWNHCRVDPNGIFHIDLSSSTPRKE